MEQEARFKKAYWHEWSEPIINEYNMKNFGKEWKGPCPVCGGKDRFWINEHDNEVKVHCRHGCDHIEIKDVLKSAGLWPNNSAKSDFIKHEHNPFSDETEKPYHLKKGVALNGALLNGSDIVIKIINAEGESVGSQTIQPNGFKRFSKDMVQEAAFSVINGPLKGLCYVAEGWATAASVSEATGRPCIFALNANNLPKVVKAIKAIKPTMEMVVAADNDAPGLKAAQAAAIPYVVPSGYNKRDWNDVHQEEGINSVKNQITKVVKPKTLWSKIGDLELKKPEWHIDGILEKHALVAGFGAPAAGKTFVMLDMVLSISSGKDYHGHAVEQGTCFYIAGEGHNGFARRCMAWANSYGIDLKDVPFFKSNKAIVMNDPVAVDIMHHTIKELSERYGKPSVVVIDTVARSMGGDENSTKDMNEFIQQVDLIKEEHGCTVLLAHHTGVATKERARGSSALLGALDCEFKIERFNDNTTTVTFTKMKDAEEPDKMAFLKVNVPMFSSDGDELSSIVLERVAVPQSSSQKISDVIKAEYDKLCELNSDDFVTRTALKKNVSIETGKSERTIDRDIKRMIDDREFITENNKLSKSWTG